MIDQMAVMQRVSQELIHSIKSQLMILLIALIIMPIAVLLIKAVQISACWFHRVICEKVAYVDASYI